MNIEHRILNIEYRTKGWRQLHFGVHYSIFIIRYSLAFSALAAWWQRSKIALSAFYWPMILGRASTPAWAMKLSSLSRFCSD